MQQARTEAWVDLGRTWHRTPPGQQSPGTRHASIWERRRGAATKGETGEQAGALHHTNTHTPEDTWEQTTHTQGCFEHSRPFNRRSCIHGAFGAPLLNSQGWFCRSACVPWKSMSMSMSMSMDGARAATCTKAHRQRSRTWHRINTQQARIQQMGPGTWSS